MPSPAFSVYVSPARLYPDIWRILVGMVLIVFIAAGFLSLMLVTLYPLVGPMNYFGFLQKLMFPAEPGPVLFILISFVGLALGPIIAAPACHGRSPSTLFGDRDGFFRCFFLTLAVLIPLFGVAVTIGWQFTDPLSNMPLGDWLRLLPFALPLVLVQVSAEELIFRGYLQQQLAARFAARWVWMGLPALLFTALHYDPANTSTVWLILGATGIFALIAADLTERTGNLGAAIGLHFVNNVVALLILATGETITGLALYITPYGASDLNALLPVLGLDCLLLILAWRLLRAVLD